MGEEALLGAGSDADVRAVVVLMFGVELEEAKRARVRTVCLVTCSLLDDAEIHGEATIEKFRREDIGIGTVHFVEVIDAGLDVFERRPTVETGICAFACMAIAIAIALCT